MNTNEYAEMASEANRLGKLLQKQEDGTYIMVDPPDVEMPERTVFTKLQIRRACRALGSENRLDALLEASDYFRKDWNDAIEIDLGDEATKEALAMGDFSAEEIDIIRHAIIASESESEHGD